MDERLQDWHPDRDEVARIVAELRPMIHELADRETSQRAAEVERLAREAEHLAV